MQTTLETIGQLERRLNLSVPLADIESEVEKRLARLAQSVKVPGFRPGKVPMKMVAQQYGPQVSNEVITDAVQSGFADAMRDQNVRVAGYPRIEPKADAARADQLEFSAVFEVYPDIRLGDLSTVIDRASGGRGRAGRCPAHDRRPPQAARPLRAGHARGGNRGSRDRRLLRDASTASSFRAARRRISRSCSAKARMLPEFDAAVTGMKRRGDEVVRAHVSRRTITARKSRAKPRTSR